MKWTPKEVEFLRENHGKISMLQIGKALGRSEASVSHKARALKLRTKSGRKRTVFCDASYFRRPNLENCYWAGFIAADGYIHRKTNLVKIDLHEKDKEHLETFAKQCKWTGELLHYDNNGSPQVRFSVRERQWIKDLNAYNIWQAKSLSLLPPVLADNLALAFIRGYFDGDGSVGTYPNGKYQKFQIQFKGTELFLAWVRRTLGITNKITHLKHTSCKQLTISGKSGKVIYEKLGEIDTPFLRRKWE